MYAISKILPDFGKRLIAEGEKIMLTIQEAEYELEKGVELNFGPWKIVSQWQQTRN